MSRRSDIGRPLYHEDARSREVRALAASLREVLGIDVTAPKARAVLDAWRRGVGPVDGGAS
ncbi:MAG: hypothetical protein QME96_10660, partial [Myxococcota bacterium]|nr:hypothetical protein [Myxococcota bacterium]